VTQGRGQPRPTQPNIRSDVVRPAVIWRTGPGTHRLPFSPLSDAERAFLDAQFVAIPRVDSSGTLLDHGTGHRDTPPLVAAQDDYRRDGRIPPGVDESWMNDRNTLYPPPSHSGHFAHISMQSGGFEDPPSYVSVESAAHHRLIQPHSQPGISTHSPGAHGWRLNTVQPSNYYRYNPPVPVQQAHRALQTRGPLGTHGHTASYPTSITQTPQQGPPSTFRDIAPRGVRQLPPQSLPGDFPYSARAIHGSRLSTSQGSGYNPGGSIRSSEVQPSGSGYGPGVWAPGSLRPQSWHDLSHPSVDPGLTRLQDHSHMNLPRMGSYTSYSPGSVQPGFQDEGDRNAQPNNGSYWPSHPDTQGDGR
jgi:hypothetical protein